TGPARPCPRFARRSTGAGSFLAGARTRSYFKRSARAARAQKRTAGRRLSPRPAAPCRLAGLLFVDGGERLLDARPGSGRRSRRRVLDLALDHHLQALVGREARARGDEAAHDDVLLEAAEIVRLAADGRLGEHLGGLLEGRGADERLGGEARLGDAEEERLGD